MNRDYRFLNSSIESRKIVYLEDDGDVVEVLVTCNDGGSVEDAVGAGVYGIVGNDKKVSYKYTLRCHCQSYNR